MRKSFFLVLSSLALGLGFAAARGQSPAGFEPPAPGRGSVPTAPMPTAVHPVPDQGGAGQSAAAQAPETPLELVEFRNLPLFDAMRLLSEESGLKIVPSAEAGKTLVSLYLQDVTPMAAVNAVSEAYGLITRVDPAFGIVRIFTTKENQTDLAAFREEQTEVFTLLYPNATNVGTAIRSLFGTRVQLSYGEPITDSLTSSDLQQRLSRFDLINSRSLGLGFFQNGSFGNGGTIGGSGIGVTSVGAGGGGVGVTSVGGVGGAGGGIGNISAFGAGGLGGAGITGTTGGGRAVAPPGTIPQVVPPTQRLEGLTPEEIQELQNATGAERERIIADILSRRPTNIYITVIEQHNQLIVRSSDTRALQEIRDLVYRLDVPTPVVLLEVKVLSVNLADDFDSMFDFQFTDGVLSAGGFSPAPPIPGFASGNILPPFADQALSRFETIAPGPLGTPPPPNFLFQVVSAKFRARLQLLETKNRVTELATPLLMTANNEVSRIFSGATIPITTGFTASQIVSSSLAATSTLAPTPVTTLQDIGTSLLITPNVNADRTVTLRILEETSTDIPNGANIPVPTTSGTITEVPVDTVGRETIAGTVVAMDGETLAFGGLIQESLNDTRSEVPVVSKIPVLGFFFRSQNTMRTRTELVILIRPFVLTTPCESQGVSHSMLEALSIHPNVPRGGLGTLGTYVPAEVLRPNPPHSELEKIFRSVTIVPKDF